MLLFGCTNRVKKDSGISFHRFPKKGSEPEKQWIRAVQGENWSPSQTSCLCSEHFAESCFIQGKTSCRLHKDVVPSVFPQFPKHLQKLNLKESQQKTEADCEPSPSKLCQRSTYISEKV